MHEAAGHQRQQSSDANAAKVSVFGMVMVLWQIAYNLSLNQNTPPTGGQGRKNE